MPASRQRRDDGLAGGCTGRPHRCRLRWCAPRASPARCRRHAACALSAMASISSVAAISRLSGIFNRADSRAISSSEICRRSSRRCAVMPSAPACCRQLRRAHRIGIVAAARIPHGGDMVDVHAEAQRLHVSSYASPLLPGLTRGNVAQMRRQLVGGPGRHFPFRQRDQRHADLGLAARAVDQAAGRHDLGAGLLDGGDAFARRDAGGDDVFHHQHLLALFQGEIAAQLELAVHPLDIHGGQAQLAAHFIARHDAAHRRRDDGGDLVLHFLRALWRPAPCTVWRCAWRPGTPAPSAGTCRNAARDDRMKWPSSSAPDFLNSFRTCSTFMSSILLSRPARLRARGRPIRPHCSPVAHPGYSANAPRRALRYPPRIRRTADCGRSPSC